jgi:hypothetical protein
MVQQWRIGVIRSSSRGAKKGVENNDTLRRVIGNNKINHFLLSENMW